VYAEQETVVVNNPDAIAVLTADAIAACNAVSVPEAYDPAKLLAACAGAISPHDVIAMIFLL
jgi:hypothetical protein